MLAETRRIPPNLSLVTPLRSSKVPCIVIIARDLAKYWLRQESKSQIRRSDAGSREPTADRSRAPFAHTGTRADAIFTKSLLRFQPPRIGVLTAFRFVVLRVISCEPTIAGDWVGMLNVSDRWRKAIFWQKTENQMISIAEIFDGASDGIRNQVREKNVANSAG